MSRKKDVTRKEAQALAYDTLTKVISDPNTSAAVKVQAATQLVRLADTIKNAEYNIDELDAFNEE